MDVYPDNAISHYTTRLRQPIDLDGRWEVALVEASVPTRWYNVTEEEYRMRMHISTSKTGKRKRYFIKSIEHSHYERPQQLHRALNRAWRELKTDIPKGSLFMLEGFADIREAFVYDADENIITMNPKLKEYPIHVTGKLGLLLGIGDGTRQWIQASNDKNVVGEVMQIDNSVNHIYLYTDIVDYVVTGDTVAPLLRILPMQSFAGNDQMDHYTHTFTKAHYIPVSRHHIESIHIDLRDDQGKNIPFVSGKSIVKLHFRRKR
jgi:hypothetical protein